MTPSPSRAARRPPLPVRIVAAPLHLLERSRGRKRFALALLYLLVLAAGLLLGWRAVSLRDLPDLGDPFDPAEFDALVVPDAENAFTSYRQALAVLKEPNPREYPVSDPKAWDAGGWATAEPAVRRWVEDNAWALELWLLGSSLDGGVEVDPRTAHAGSRFGATQGLRSFARLGRLEASRRLEAGDAAGAWEVYRGVLRASRHAGRGGGAIQRLVATAMVRYIDPGIRAWMADPRIGVEDLRRALADVRAADHLTAPASEAAKVEYLIARNTLTGPDRWPVAETFRAEEPHPLYFVPGGVEAALWLKREPERSLRVARILFDAWIAQADRPPSGRAAMTSRESGSQLVGTYSVYPPTPRAGMGPETLIDWLDSTLMARASLGFSGAIQGHIDGDVRALPALEIALAEELFRREQGRESEGLDELIGPYLDRVPAGFGGVDGGD